MVNVEKKEEKKGKKPTKQPHKCKKSLHITERKIPSPKTTHNHLQNWSKSCAPCSFPLVVHCGRHKRMTSKSYILRKFLRKKTINIM